VFRPGYDTKQVEQVLQIGPTHEDINDIERHAKNYMRMRHIREFGRRVSASAASAARGLGASVTGAIGRTASAARGLGASASGIFKRLTTDPRFAQDKLILANYGQLNADEGAGLQNFLKKSNDIYDTNYNKVGKYYDGKAYFLPDHYNPKISWTMSKMDPLSKN
jgi:hypothetical protein